MGSANIIQHLCPTDDFGLKSIIQHSPLELYKAHASFPKYLIVQPLFWPVTWLWSVTLSEKSIYVTLH